MGAQLRNHEGRNADSPFPVAGLGRLEPQTGLSLLKGALDADRAGVWVEVLNAQGQQFTATCAGRQR